MPDVKVKTPGGGTVTVRAPEGASQDDILAFAKQQYNQQKEGFMQFFGRGLKKGAESTFASGGSAEAKRPYKQMEQFEERRGLLPAVEERYPTPKTLKGRIAQGMGEGIANPQIALGPIGGLARRAVTGAISSAGSELAGMVSKDNPLMRLLGGVAGGVAGGKVANVGARGVRAAAEAAQPQIPTERAPAVQALQARGIQPSAGDALGSETVKHLEKLGDWWFGGASYKQLKQQTLGAFTNAALEGIGESGNRLTPRMIQNVHTRFDRSAQSLAKRLPVEQNKPMGDEISKIRQEVFRYGSDTATKVIHNLAEDINNGFETKNAGGNTMEWRKYQSLTSHRSPLSRAMRSNDDDIRYYAGRLRTALDDAMEATVQKEVQKIKTTDPTAQFRRGQAGLPARQRAIDIAEAYEEFKQRRREWYNMIILSKSVATGGESAAEGLILPQKLQQNLTNGQDNKLAYAAQRSNLQQLARAGVNIIEPYERPSSWRAAVAPIVALGGLFTSPLTGTAGLSSAGLASTPGLLGRAVNSPRVQDYLRGERMRNLTEQLMTWKETAARGGLVGATNQSPESRQQMASPVSPMMLNRAKEMAGSVDRGLRKTLGSQAASDALGATGIGMAAPKFAQYSPTLIRNMIKSGKKLYEIAEHYGVSPPAISVALKKMGIKAPQPGGGLPKMATTEELVRRLDGGETQAQIAKSLGVSPNSLSNRLRNEGLTKLTADEWREVKETYGKKKPLQVTVHPERSRYGGSDE